MDVLTHVSRRSLFWILFFNALACAVLNGVVILWQGGLVQELSDLSRQSVSARSLEWITQMLQGLEAVEAYFLPATAALFLLAALLTWLCCHLSFSKALRSLQPAPNRKKIETVKPKTKPDDPLRAQEAEKALNDQRLFLHLVGALQKDGRFLDFLSEDLAQYEDEQIGAAVRDIHDNCKKTIEKYIKTIPVLPQEEETEITIPTGFDPATVKLTGNVTGDPPFKGIVRHRGWKAQRVELPSFSGSRDPAILTPAEVEVE